jgi:hypothetical protein
MQHATAYHKYVCCGRKFPLSNYYGELAAWSSKGLYAYEQYALMALGMYQFLIKERSVSPAKAWKLVCGQWYFVFT